jgi:predicted GNAT family N-acyltransferase
MTVFSSPYAAGFYRKMGFADTDAEQTVNGIRFIPMKRSVEAEC